MDTNILLENGTNELEVLEFTLNNNHYGINVAKIREILSYQPVTPIPNAQPQVEGIFMPRDAMITVISLKKCLSLDIEGEQKGLFIITNFNKLDLAFHVDEFIGIHRVSWADIIEPDSTINAGEDGVSTGVIKLGDKLVIILLKELCPELDITVIVRGFPVINDATLEDAQDIGLTELTTVIGNGNDIGGTWLPHISSEAREALESADMIIAKGQGNYETLHDCGLNIYYLFLCKCKWFQYQFHAEPLQGMFINERRI